MHNPRRLQKSRTLADQTVAVFLRCACLTFSIALVGNANASESDELLIAADHSLALPDNRVAAVKCGRELWQTGLRNDETDTQARGLIRMGWASLHFGDWGDHAGVWRREAESRVAKLPATNIARAEVLMFEGYIDAFYLRKFAVGISRIQKSITLGRTLGDDRFLAKAFYLLGKVLPYDGQSELSFDCLHRSAMFARRARMPAWEYKALLETVRFGSGRVHNEEAAVRRSQLREQLGFDVPLEDLPLKEQLVVAKRQMEYVDLPPGTGVSRKLPDVLAGLKAAKFLSAHYLSVGNWDEWSRALEAARQAAGYLQDGTSYHEMQIERAAGLAQQGKIDEAIAETESFIKTNEEIGNFQALARVTNYIARHMGKGGNNDIAYKWFVRADEYQQQAFDRRLRANRGSAKTYCVAEIESRLLQSQLDAREKTLGDTRFTIVMVLIGACALAISVWYWQRDRQHRFAEQRLQGLVDEKTESLRIAKESAERANRAKTDFLARVNHELRNPLTAIVSSCEILGDCIDDDPVAIKCGETITACSQGLVDVIDEILDFTQIESGELTLRPGEFSPQAMLSTVRSIVEDKLHDDVEFRVLIDPDTPDSIRTDQAKLRQVLLNLVANSARHTDSGFVRIECSVSRRGSQDVLPRLTFAVEDSGCGMSDKAVANVFRQYRTSSERSQTGLGLYISQGFVRCLGGRIDCSSEPGRGTRFTVEIPFSAVEAQENDPRKADDAIVMAGTGFSFLVIDDEAPNRETIEILLQRLQHSVTTASQWAEAKRVLQNQSVDVVLLDLQMPQMNGFEVIERIQSLNLASVPRVFAMAGDATQVTRERTVAAGFSGFLAKPFRVADLERLLERSSQRRAA